jgi:hypothetical protein
MRTWMALLYLQNVLLECPHASGHILNVVMWTVQILVDVSVHVHMNRGFARNALCEGMSREMIGLS